MAAIERTDRDTLGRLVRKTWIEWAREQSNAEPSWLVPWEELPEPDREADRRIGEVIQAYVAAEALAPADDAEVTRWLGTCPGDGITIGIIADGADAAAPSTLTTTCLCGTPVDFRVVGREEYEAALGDDDDEDDDGVPLLEDFDGAPYPDEVQRAHRLVVRPWLAACDAVGVPHDPDALITHHRGNAALAAVCAATADQLQAAERRGAVKALMEYASNLEERSDYRDQNEAIVMRTHARRVESGQVTP